MIVLFNLNNYIGGGEVYIISLAEYLERNNHDFIILCSKNSFISSRCEEKGFKYKVWPITELSINYSSKSQLNEIVKFFSQLNLTYSDVVLACNMREIYSTLFFISKYKFQIRVIVLHPEEYKYLASGSIYFKKFHEANRSILRDLDNQDLILYPNVNARNVSLGCIENYKKIYPFPVSISIHQSFKPKRDFHVVRLLIFSRFVSFKISTILSLIKTVYLNKNYELKIIGYGFWKILLIPYLLLYKTNRISLINKVQPEELKDFVINSDVGIAQGTSILQFISCGVPVIIAPYSKWYSFFRSDVKSPGIFGEDKKINWGDVYWNLERENYTFKFLIDKVIANYGFYVKSTLEITQSLNENIIFKKLTDDLLNYKHFNLSIDFKVIRPPLIKLILKKFFSIFK
jgi:hypothetical protein